MAHVWLLDNCPHTHTHTCPCGTVCVGYSVQLSHTLHTNSVCVCVHIFIRPSPSLTCPSHRSRATHTHTWLHLARREARDMASQECALPPFSFLKHSFYSVVCVVSVLLWASAFQSTQEHHKKRKLSFSWTPTHTHTRVAILVAWLKIVKADFFFLHLSDVCAFCGVCLCLIRVDFERKRKVLNYFWKLKAL